MSIVIDLGDLFPYNGADKILAGKFYLHGVPANRALALKSELKKILPLWLKSESIFASLFESVLLYSFCIL